MMKIASPFLILLMSLAGPAYGAELPALVSAAVIAESMRRASNSDGLEVRMSIITITPNGDHSAPMKLAVIGQFGVERQRLLIRGISPAKVRNRLLAAERSADGRIRSIEYRQDTAGDLTAVDPFTNSFDSGPVVWDMFGPWWYWAKQSLGGTEQIGGHECLIVRSQVDAGASPISEVVSCVSKGAKLSLRTQLFDSHHTLVRAISVAQTTSRESGTMAARRMSVTGADGSVTEVEIYSADEHHYIASDTFAALDASPAAGR